MIVDEPVRIVADAQIGLKPGATGIAGLPCGVTRDPIRATALLEGPANTVIAPDITVPGGPNNGSVTSLTQITGADIR